jgi:hypothetical protein
MRNNSEQITKQMRNQTKQKKDLNIYGGWKCSSPYLLGVERGEAFQDVFIPTNFSKRIPTPQETIEKM